MRRGAGTILIVVASGAVLAACSNGSSSGSNDGSIGGCQRSTYSLGSEAMTPAIDKGEQLFADDGAYADADPQRGDVVLFKIPPRNRVDTLVRRVIGLPGEEIAIADGKVIVDGTPLDEPWVDGPTAPIPDAGTQWSLGAAEYFVMGDNRAESRDSRSWGPIQRVAIKSRVCLIAETTTTH